MNNKKIDWSKIKVAHVTAVESTFTALFYNQLKELRRQGLQVTCIATLEMPENLRLLDQIGVKFIEVPIQRKLTPFSDLVSVYRLWRVFRREKFDLIHTQLPKSTLLGALAGWLSGTKVVNTARPYFTEMPPGLRRTFWVWIERIADYFSDAVMVENPFDFENYVNLKIATREKLSVQGNGIDLSRFDPAKVDNSALDRLKAELKLPPNAKVVGIVARFVIDKGFLELLTAFKELYQKYPNLYLLCAILDLPSERGTVPDDLPEKMGIADRVIILKNRRDMELIYTLIDIFALPTYRDCFPRAIIEAAAMAKPIVASDIPGCQVVVENEKSGLLVPLRDPKPLARAMERLLNDPAFAQSLGENARKHALAELDEQKICQRILDCYQTLLEKKK
jgi:glycosyltransferase involved in cell wall biosynthesis